MTTAFGHGVVYVQVYIINEHPDWLGPVGKSLDAIGVPWAEWFADEGSIMLDQPPPPGVFFNRMSASATTRGHLHSAAHTRELIAWLEVHGRRVLNGSRAFELEMSKARQHSVLKAAGLNTPRTLAVVGGPDAIIEAAESQAFPFILKPNRGGKGLGVRLAASMEQLVGYVRSADFEASPDGVTLLQEYIRAPEPFITRCEFVGDEFVYAIRSNTTDGFELCPADGCAPCAIGGKFALREGFDDPILEQYRALVRSAGLDVCGIEFIEDQQGRKYTYDLNGTTNYNPAIEAASTVSASARLAELMARELARAGGGSPLVAHQL